MNKNELASEIALLARRLYVELDTFSKDFGTTHGLNQTDMKALVLIMDAARNDKPISPKELSEKLDLTTASVTALLDRLEAVDHIRRSMHPSDRRSIIIIPGEHAMKVGRKYFTSLNNNMVKTLGLHDITKLLSAYEIMNDMVTVVAEQNSNSGKNK